jgi:hypothetical protein
MVYRYRSSVCFSLTALAAGVMAASLPLTMRSAESLASDLPPAVSTAKKPDRLDPFPRVFAELQLSPEKIRRLRELMRVPETTALEIEAEISRGAYRSRQEALDVYTLACTEAETEIQKLLTPLAYARFTTVRDEAPARQLLDAYDRALAAATPSVPVTVFTDETFDRLVTTMTAICRRHGITPAAAPPPGASRTDDLAPYLAAREATDADIARILSPVLADTQLATLVQFQTDQRNTLAALWRQTPARTWAQRR